MTARDDGTPRTLRLPVVIQTWGEHCHSEDESDQCPRLYTPYDGAWCGLFGDHLPGRDDEDLDGTRPPGPPPPVRRCPECLALDEQAEEAGRG